MKKPKIELYLSLLTVAAIAIAWFVGTSSGSVSELFIPSPKSVWHSFTDVLRDGYKGSTLLQHLGTSMKRLIIAYLLCVVTAVPVGLLSGYNSKIRALLEPIIEFCRPLPPLAYYTILTLWMGIRGTDWHRGVVFQNPPLYEWFSVRSNVAFGPKMRG